MALVTACACFGGTAAGRRPQMVPKYLGYFVQPILSKPISSMPNAPTSAWQTRSLSTRAQLSRTRAGGNLGLMPGYSGPMYSFADFRTCAQLQFVSGSK